MWGTTTGSHFTVPSHARADICDNFVRYLFKPHRRESSQFRNFKSNDQFCGFVVMFLVSTILKTPATNQILPISRDCSTLVVIVVRAGPGKKQNEIVSAVPRSVFRISTYSFDTVLLMHQRTHSKPFFFYPATYERSEDPKILKKRPYLRQKLKKIKAQLWLCVYCTCVANTMWFQFLVEARKTTRGMPFSGIPV